MPVNYPPKCEIFVCPWMTLSNNVQCQHWAIEGQNLLTSLIRNFARFQNIVLMILQSFLRTVPNVLQNWIRKREKKLLAELNATSFRIFRFSKPLSIINYSLTISLCSLVSKAIIYMYFGTKFPWYNFLL